MALRTALLVALLEGESSGYDLAKAFDTTMANFWSATPQQLYRELERLAADGLVEARLVEQERRPTKRVFRLTEAGENAIRAFTRSRPKASVIRDDLLVQVQAVDAGDMTCVAGAIAHQIDLSRNKLARYERRRERFLQGGTEADFLARAERIGPYLALLRGIHFENENIRWGTTALAAIQARSGE
ncbi:MAG: PadR family transcriptional regulator [Tetrasphaera sp.]|jgi:DNA-binding PadR family transcriptional regulator|nr:PadR family transcriptional regulator [Tetrasphaera sp.]